MPQPTKKTPPQSAALIHSILASFQAPNPEYNLNLTEASKTVRVLTAFNIPVGPVTVTQTSATGQTPAATLTPEELAEQLQRFVAHAEIPEEMGLYFNVEVSGQTFNLAQIRVKLDNPHFQAEDFRQLWQGFQIPIGTSESALQNVPGVGTATDDVLQTLIASKLA